MQDGGVHKIEIVFLLLLLFVAAFGALACKLKTPYPIVLVIAGLLLGFVPGIPRITLNPDIIFFVVLPPLLYSAAWRVPWREFSYNLVSITSLAFGLVTFTVLGVAEMAHRFLPGFDWRTGFALGAVVAPTDAIAATSIARRMGLPKRIVDILEGESLVNDASALLALEFGVAMLVRGQAPTVVSGLLRLAYLAAVGLVVGLLIGVIVNWIERRIDPRIRGAGGRGLRTLPQPQKLGLFFAGRAFAGKCGLGISDFHPQRTGVHIPRTATPLRPGGRPGS